MIDSARNRKIDYDQKVSKSNKLEFLEPKYNFHHLVLISLYNQQEIRQLTKRIDFLYTLS